MKLKIFILAAICTGLSLNTADAAVTKCRWINGGVEKKIGEATLPSVIDLRNAPVGSIVASSPPLVFSSTGDYICPDPGFRAISVEIESASLSEGFLDVYQTGIVGIGVRLIDLDLRWVIPYKTSYNGTGGTIKSLKNIRFDFVRTAKKISTGTVTMSFSINQFLNKMHLLEVKFVGNTKIQTQEYFTGCAGVEQISISMGRVAIANIGAQQRSFNLDVLCSGMPAGTKVPVKVYFEGDSDGPGRLNLEPGGAQGVEISLVNDRGVKLPFSLGGALEMTWVRSEPLGEIYRLPVVAEYMNKASQKAVAGRANATLNYILEYN